MLIKNFVDSLLEGSKAKGFSIFEEIVIREIKTRSRSVIRRGETIEKLRLQSQYTSREEIAKILKNKLTLKKYSDLIVTLEVIENSILALKSTEKKILRYADVLHNEQGIGKSVGDVYKKLIRGVFNELVGGKRVPISIKEPTLELIKTGFRGEALASGRYFGSGDVEEVFKEFLKTIFNSVKPQPNKRNTFPDFHVSGRKTNIPQEYKNFLGGRDNIWIEAKSGGLAKSSTISAKEFLDENGEFSLDKLNKDVAYTMLRLGWGYPKGTSVKSLYFMRLGTGRVYFEKLKTPFIFGGKFKYGGKEVHLKAKGTRSREERDIYYFLKGVPYFRLSKTTADKPNMSLKIMGKTPFEEGSDSSYPFRYFENILKPGPKPKKESVEYKLSTLLMEVNNAKTK
jgi:hypothetical protein